MASGTRIVAVASRGMNDVNGAQVCQSAFHCIKCLPVWFYFVFAMPGIRWSRPPLRAATSAAGTMERLEERTGARRRIGQGKLKR